ncbi:YbjQ family protein [Polaribacter sp. BAL334]|uniref:YbjQ family protein n=1 Tax=Polaribacter sp. BAL334 TaxID=1708178 RepID=UPI0018D2085B|nr:heavy metal-binding domain-containing protein [Polaribacter sp. BAL334]MBG7611655.1 YbjQ family protein [Polaribacter sp. BAL334]
MKKSKDIIVTTTSSLEGMNIVKHLKPISAHIVIGTNIFSDFLGGLTDVFGGKSNSYQKKLKEIYEDAIKEIKFACNEVGGNCVLGLKIDIDEISGKGKSMFMITAIGTAVIVESDKKDEDIYQKINEHVSVDELNELRTKKSIIYKAENSNLELTAEIWSFITNNRMVEMLPFLMKKVAYAGANYGNSHIDDFSEKLKIFIENLPESQKKKYLYDSLKNNKNENSNKIILDIIKSLYLLDVSETIGLLENEKLSVKKLGLLISTYDQLNYSQNDIDNLQLLKKTIEITFTERGERTTKKQMLSSKEKEVWVCECSKVNNSENEYCESCLKDIFGFEKIDLRPEKVISHLGDKINLIRELI